MTQIGRVVSATEGLAQVEVQRASACGENCAHCKGGCVPTHHLATVKNTAGAHEGDMVRIETQDGAVLKSACMVYLLPLFILFVCYGATEMLFAIATLSATAGVIGMVAGLFVLRALDRKIAPVPEIAEIIYRKGREEE